jgi:hypothetical protein
MKRIFDFLYYCLYRMFALIKRVGEKDENLASSFYAVLLSTNTLMLVALCKFYIPLHLVNQYLLKGSFFIFFFIWYFVCKYYFLKKENYLRIITIYEAKYKRRNKQMAVVGVFYSITTFLSFYMTVVYMVNGTYF